MTARFLLFCRIVILAAPMLAQVSLPGMSVAPQASSLSLEEVVELSKSGFSEELIITRIKKHGKGFDLSTEELLELRKIGISDNIIKFLLDPSQPYVPSSQERSEPKSGRGAAPADPAREYPKDPNAARVPPKPGLYWFPKPNSGEPIAIDLKLLLGVREGPGLGRVLLKKGKTIAYLVGLTSKTRIANEDPVFYLRLPERKIEEVVLVALEAKNKRRELDMGSSKKQELNAESIRQFDSLPVGPDLFKITVSKLPKGEYLFFLIGSAEPEKGTLGKGYDFGIDESQR
jgi:hypothetical protein